MKNWRLGSFSFFSILVVGIYYPVTASPPAKIIAQAPFSNLNRVTVLSNPNWQIVPGAEVGRHPAETLMDLNGIVRDEDAVTFDVMGYRGTYYRMVGHCQTRQVAVIRRGLSQSIQQFSYEEVQPNPAESLDWHRQLLAFACQNSDDCPEKVAEQKKLQEQLNLLEQTEEKYAHLAGMLQSKTYDFSRILGGWEDTLVDLERLSTELTGLETQLHEKMPNNQYQEWLKEYQSLNSINWTSEPSIIEKYNAFVGKFCDQIPDWGEIIPIFYDIGDIAPGLTDNPMLSSFVNPVGKIPFVSGIPLTCLADQLDSSSFTPAQQRFYEQYRADKSRIINDLNTYLETTIFTKSSLADLQKERQDLSNEIYRIINRDIYDHTGTEIDNAIKNRQTPSPDAMLSMLSELDAWQAEIKAKFRAIGE